MKPDQSKKGRNLLGGNSNKAAKRSKLEPERDLWAVPDSLIKPLYKTISATEADTKESISGKRTNFTNRVNKQKAGKALNQAKRNRFK